VFFYLFIVSVSIPNYRERELKEISEYWLKIRQFICRITSNTSYCKYFITFWCFQSSTFVDVFYQKPQCNAICTQASLDQKVYCDRPHDPCISSSARFLKNVSWEIVASCATKGYETNIFLNIRSPFKQCEVLIQPFLPGSKLAPRWKTFWIGYSYPFAWKSSKKSNETTSMMQTQTR